MVPASGRGAVRGRPRAGQAKGIGLKRSIHPPTQGHAQVSRLSPPSDTGKSVPVLLVPLCSKEPTVSLR